MKAFMILLDHGSDGNPPVKENKEYDSGYLRFICPLVCFYETEIAAKKALLRIQVPRGMKAVIKVVDLMDLE